MAAVAMGLVAVLALSACQNWTQFMGGAAHTGDDNGETTISTGNVASLHLAFTLAGSWNTITDAGITTANGQIFVAGGGTTALGAFSFGSTNCSGTPNVCQPLWTAGRANFGGAGSVSEPTVANNVVYQSSAGISGGDLRAFDAKGVTNCSGTPVVCQPLWTANAPSDAGAVVDSTNLFIISTSGLEAFDANGVTNCAGSPVVCQPLWTAPVTARWIPTVANGKVYVATSAAPDELEAFDEAGTTNCSGVPKVCQPLFTAPLPGTVPGSVDVSGGVAYVETTGGLAAVDAAGSTSCSGTPVVCQPLWTAPGANTPPTGGTPTVADGHVFGLTREGINVVTVNDAAGVVGCSGSPVVCVSGGTPGGTLATVSLTVSNGLVWLGNQVWIESVLAGCNSPTCPGVASLPGGTTQGPTTISIGTALLNQGGTISAYQT